MAEGATSLSPGLMAVTTPPPPRRYSCAWAGLGPQLGVRQLECDWEMGRLHTVPPGEWLKLARAPCRERGAQTCLA